MITHRQPARQPRPRPLVLLVDDDIDERRIYGEILCYNGFDVLLVPDGRSALRSVATQHPSLILLDLGLPDMSGLDVCARLRRMGAHARLPVIALSGFAEKDMGPRARAAGCVHYMEKPASPVAVLHRVEELVGRAPLAGEGAPPQLTERT